MKHDTIKLRKLISKNLTTYRINAGLTKAELAKKPG